MVTKLIFFSIYLLVNQNSLGIFSDLQHSNPGVLLQNEPDQLKINFCMVDQYGMVLPLAGIKI